jgi:hypothetical protein
VINLQIKFLLLTLKIKKNVGVINKQLNKSFCTHTSVHSTLHTRVWVPIKFMISLVHYQKVHDLCRPSSVARVVNCKRLQWLDTKHYRNRNS